MFVMWIGKILKLSWWIFSIGLERKVICVIELCIFVLDIGFWNWFIEFIEKVVKERRIKDMVRGFDGGIF